MPDSAYNLQNSLYCSPVNNTGYDPLQGFDVELWVQDVCTGLVAWFGKFQSLTVSVRNATETYLELGQRIPIHLDGEIQIAWVLEQGAVDWNVIERTFGVPMLRRDSFITRGPRFQISYDVNAPELTYANKQTGDGVFDRNHQTDPQWSADLAKQTAKNVGTQSFYRYGADEFTNFGKNQYAQRAGDFGPKSKGMMTIFRAKVDNWSMGAMPGRRVVAYRWEGVAEGIGYRDVTIQAFKTRRFEDFGATGGGFVPDNVAVGSQVSRSTGVLL